MGLMVILLPFFKAISKIIRCRYIAPNSRITVFKVIGKSAPSEILRCSGFAVLSYRSNPGRPRFPDPTDRTAPPHPTLTTTGGYFSNPRLLGRLIFRKGVAISRFMGPPISPVGRFKSYRTDPSWPEFPDIPDPRF